MNGKIYQWNIHLCSIFVGLASLLFQIKDNVRGKIFSNVGNPLLDCLTYITSLVSWYRAGAVLELLTSTYLWISPSSLWQKKSIMLFDQRSCLSLILISSGETCGNLCRGIPVVALVLLGGTCDLIFWPSWPSWRLSSCLFARSWCTKVFEGHLGQEIVEPVKYYLVDFFRLGEGVPPNSATPHF